MKYARGNRNGLSLIETVISLGLLSIALVLLTAFMHGHSTRTSGLNQQGQREDMRRFFREALDCRRTLDLNTSCTSFQQYPVLYNQREERLMSGQVRDVPFGSDYKVRVRCGPSAPIGPDRLLVEYAPLRGRDSDYRNLFPDEPNPFHCPPLRNVQPAWECRRYNCCADPVCRAGNGQCIGTYEDYPFEGNIPLGTDFDPANDNGYTLYWGGGRVRHCAGIAVKFWITGAQSGRRVELVCRSGNCSGSQFLMGYESKYSHRFNPSDFRNLLDANGRRLDYRYNLHYTWDYSTNLGANGSIPSCYGAGRKAGYFIGTLLMPGLQASPPGCGGDWGIN